MSDWGPTTYGEPCRECAFSWAIDPDSAVELVAGAPSRFDATLAGVRGDERHPELTWSVSAYVAHVADNLRIWAERIAGITMGAPREVAPYDESELARVRGYDRIPLPAARWSLERSVRDWLEAVGAAPEDLVMIHPQRGPLHLRQDVVRTNAHDVAHHEWDVRRILARVD